MRFGTALVLLAGVGLLAGCGTGGPGTPNVKVAPGKKPGDIAPPPSGQESGPDEFARAFLKALGGGSAKVANLTPAFRTLVARPQTEEDRKTGYSELGVQGWLDRLDKAEYKVREVGEQGGRAYARGEVVGGKQPEAFFLSAGKGEGGAWQVDWFHRTTVTNPQVTTSKFAEAEQAAYAARAFLETLLGGDLALTEAMMAQSLKASLADPRPSDQAIGYNPGLLQLKLRTDWKGDFTNYSLRQGQEAGSFTGELLGAAGQKRPFALKLAKDRGERWLVTEFKPG